MRETSPSAQSSFTGISAPPLTALFEQLTAGPGGLTSEEAQKRLIQFGANRLEERTRLGLLAAYLSRLRNPLVLVLAAAALVSATTGELASLVIITVILGLSITLDVVLEHRALTEASRLKEKVSLTARVLRDGQWSEQPAARLVPGDMIALSAGDLIPADCRLVQSRDLYVNEALLTGEAYPAEKQAGPDAGTGLLPRNTAFMGSSVLSGSAQALVVATGKRAELGRIAGALRKPPPDTAFDIGIRDFGRMLLRATLLLVLAALLINLAFHRPPLQSLLFSLALAVGLTPELLPMVISVTLAHGAVRLSRRDVIVKRLSAIHDLGAMDMLCSDKTGTLTEARISLARTVDLGGSAAPAALEAAVLNAHFETGLKSPIDAAILAETKPDLASWRKIDEAPFDFERRRVCVLVEGNGDRRLIVKGAPEDVLALCDTSLSGGMAMPLDDASRDRARAAIRSLENDGYRVLGVAQRRVGPECVSAAQEGATLSFLGLLAFTDPPKPGVDTALAALKELGVAVKIVTGDGEMVTRHLCALLGIPVLGCLAGPELAGLSDDALLARLDQVSVFCRMTPPQKSRVIAALRRKGHVVGYLGDGINDAPSLHAADVGFSVDTAVDVAKEAASMILLRKDLAVIAEGVREGRRTYVNILKYIMMGTSSNFGNMFSMAGGALLLPFLPLLPIQILLNNLLYDLSETAIPLDRVEDAALARPRRWNIAHVRNFMMVLGPLSSLFDFITFALLLWLFASGETVFHTGWFMESMTTQILVIFVIRSARPWRNPPHPMLILSSLLALAAALALPYLPVGAWLGFTPLPAKIAGALLLVSLAYLASMYAARRWFFARHALF